MTNPMDALVYLRAALDAGTVQMHVRDIHESSPPSLIWRTVSAVIGRRPFEMTKPLRFTVFRPLGTL
jgi:hypothetical protein